MREYIEAGRIINTHGVRGAVKAESWCDSPAVLKKMKRLFFRQAKENVFLETKVLSSSVAGNYVILRLDGITSPEQAESLKNTVFFAHRDDIPVSDGAVLVDDIKGLKVLNAENGRVYGFLSDVLEIGGRELYEIDCSGKKVLLPAVKEFIKKIDVTAGIYIKPIGGFFDEN